MTLGVGGRGDAPARAQDLVPGSSSRSRCSAACGRARACAGVRSIG